MIRKFISDVSGGEYPEHQKVSAKNLSHSILEFIQSFQEWVQNPKLSIKNNIYVFNFVFNNLNFEFYFSDAWLDENIEC